MRIFHALAIALAVASILVLAGCNPRQEPDPNVTAEPVGDGLGFSYSHPLLTRYAPDDPKVAPFVVTADDLESADAAPATASTAAPAAVSAAAPATTENADDEASGEEDGGTEE